MSEEYSTVKVDKETKSKLDEIKAWRGNRTFSETIEQIVETERMAKGYISVEGKVNNHEEAARKALEKAVEEEFLSEDISRRNLIEIIPFDQQSIYKSLSEKDLKKAVNSSDTVKIDHDKKIDNFEEETKLFLVLGSPSKGVIEVIRKRENSMSQSDWDVNYMWQTSFFHIEIKSTK